MTKKLDNLVGIDAAGLMRQALAEMRACHAAERARADREGPEADVVLEVPCMAFENSDGSWRLETLSDFVACQDGQLSVTERTERLCEAELRFELMDKLVAWRFCNATDARRFASRARISVHGRVPHHRIVSR